MRKAAQGSRILFGFSFGYLTACSFAFARGRPSCRKAGPSPLYRRGPSWGKGMRGVRARNEAPRAPVSDGSCLARRPGPSFGG